jgi:hypothetical protein
MAAEIREWGDPYPNPDALRTEVRVATDTFLEALREVVPATEIAGLYVKGSGIKPWTSPIDYVPVLSDVDIHALFADDAAVARCDTLDFALALSRSAERRYRTAVPDAIHVPRIQMLFANRLFASPTFVPSPDTTVEDRFGVPYPRYRVDSDVGRQINVQNCLQHGDYLAGLPYQIQDLTGPHLRGALRDMSWRVGPTVPRVLELMGVDFLVCWGINRTKLVQLLVDAGDEQMAADYQAFYVGGWSYFLSADMDGEPAREAIAAGARVIRQGMRMAERLAKQSTHGGGSQM